MFLCSHATALFQGREYSRFVNEEPRWQIISYVNYGQGGDVKKEQWVGVGLPHSFKQVGEAPCLWKLNRNSLNKHLVEDLVTYDFTLHSRVRDDTPWFWRCLGTAFGHFHLGSNILWSRLLARVCEVAQTLLAFSVGPPLKFCESNNN